MNKDNHQDIDVFIPHEDLIILSTEYKEEYDKSLKHITVKNNNGQNDIPVYRFGLYPEDDEQSGYYNFYHNYSTGIHTYNFALYPKEHQPSGTVNISKIMDFYKIY